MPHITNYIIYIFLFISLYYEVFLLITYFERRLLMQSETRRLRLGVKKYPTVTIIVPCWNEEKTVSATVNSLLNLNYPKDKLKIMIVDDGSTDSTWQVIQKFANKKQIEIYHKENGGKHTALNLGLSKLSTDLVGCLDADSFVDKDALRNSVVYFEDKETMVVTPSIKIWKPKNIIELIQKVEYAWGIFVRKMLSYMGAMYVTPGPFSIFRREVFEKLGGYRYAHSTEDMEMAMRLQANHYKIANSHNSVVYTVAPDALKKLYKQRLRWTYGFIKNAIDYKYLFFKKEYGNLGIFVLPMASISIFSAIYVLSLTVFSFLRSIFHELIKINTVGLHWPTWSFNWFAVNTGLISVISLLAFCGTVLIIVVSRRMADGKFKLGMDLIYFFAIYAFIAPLWLSKAVYNSIFSIKTKWR
jgi:cellulose synthase/poly-beta-1,6-N-acetylglucosamine synthase-like glycosyltransferase